MLLKLYRKIVSRPQLDLRMTLHPLFPFMIHGCIFCNETSAIGQIAYENSMIKSSSPWLMNLFSIVSLVWVNRSSKDCFRHRFNCFRNICLFMTVFDCKLNLCCPFLLQIPAILPFSFWVRSVINDVTKGCGSTWHPAIFSLWREITYHPTNPNSSERLPDPSNNHAKSGDEIDIFIQLI